MASHQTTNFQLCQWEADDEVLRTDFNADNLKIENALSAIKTVADVAFTPENSPIVIGSYTGDGTASRKIEVGFTPKAVLVMPRYGERYVRNSTGNYTWGGLAVAGSGVTVNGDEGAATWVEGRTALLIEEGGFRVGSSSLYFDRPATNSYGTYQYIAFR